MSNKTKSRPAGGTAGAGQGENAACDGAAFSNTDSSIPPARRQVVSDWLGTGAENAQTMKQLLGFLNGDSRTIRLQIERERRGGCPILSGQSGYWIAGSADEVNSFCRSMRHRARQIWASAANVERAAGLSKCPPQLDGQLEIQIGGGAIER